MHKSNTAVFISAGLLNPKKRDHPLARRQLYLNYGALSLATKLNLAGQRAILIHGEHRSPESILNAAIASGTLPSRHPLMLSIPSFYALPWARDFCKLVTKSIPDSKIIVGGRWVVGPDPDWLGKQIPEAQLSIPGLGESIIERLLTETPDQGELSHSDPTPNYPLHHPLAQNYLSYQPSIEVSRGCGMGCQFCEERSIPLQRLRSPKKTAQFMALLQDQYHSADIHPYFQASFFAPNNHWADRFAEQCSTHELRTQWRAETRVDAMKPDVIASLAEAGLKVIDLGLETASPTQILAMRKSKSPDRYLKSASQLLNACNRHGVAVKVNVLLYAGETEKTIAETKAWLDQHSDCIKGVSVGPVVAFGPPKTATPLLKQWAAYGARPVDSCSAEMSGITTVHLSKDIDAASAEQISLALSRRYMSADAYFELKKFSYYPRDFKKLDFLKDARNSDPQSLPFRLDTETALRAN